MQIARQKSSSKKPSAYFLLAAEQSENSEYNILHAVKELSSEFSDFSAADKK